MNRACSTADLELALAGNLPADREELLHRHLEQCEACSAALEQMAGGAAWCREAAALLPEDELDGAAPTREEWSVADFTVEHLEPCDEPGVLGRLAGYDVLEIIGRGGMGVVLKGFDRELKRCVAIKVLSPHLAQSSLARKRFAREAQAAAAVVHPNVMAIYQVQPGGRLPFLVMPLVAGQSLAARLAAQGHLELTETLRIGMQAAAALAAAHEQGLVHRDVKPANILLEKGVERALLTDFGLARAADDVSMTRWGIIAGTPQYMSPEQARGEPLDARSDLFSLGCVLYEMATGVSPFRADSVMATLRRLIDDPPPAIDALNPELPPWFIAIVERLLEKDPSRRFRSAKEVGELLEGCLAHLQQPAGVPLPETVRGKKGRLPIYAQHPSARARKWSSDKGGPSPFFTRLRRTLFKGTIAMLAVFGAVLGGMFLMQSPESPDIAGRWSGEGWGQVVLTRTAAGKYAGTYTETAGKEPGKIDLKWSADEGRFNGTWREGEERFGALSIRLADREIRGALTTDPDSKTSPARPRLGDLVWSRVEDPKSKSAALNPASETEALLGQWKVVRVEQGRGEVPALRVSQGYIDFNKINRLFFQEGQLEAFSLRSGEYATRFQHYRVHGGTTPLAIDFFEDGREKKESPAALGIYEINGDRLSLRMRRVVPGMKNPSRPTSLTDEPAANDISLALERYQPPADEIAARGCWDIVLETDDGKVVSQEPGLDRICWFYENSAIDINKVAPTENVLSGRYVMEGGISQAKAIAISQYRGKDLLGIYKFEGKRLHIAYRKGGPRPEKFESTPGSGVTLLVLEGENAARIAKPAPSPAVDPAAEFKALEGPWKVVRAETSEAAASELSQAYRLDFDPTMAVLSYSKKGFHDDLAYSIDPTTTPRTIDLFWTDKTLRWLGIYQLEGDRLNVCLVKRIPALDKQQRPSRFDRAAGDALIVLERYRPSEDEKALRNQRWQYVSQTVDGKTVADTRPRGTMENSLRLVGGNAFAARLPFDDDTELWGGTYVLDHAKKPKTITLFARLMRTRGGAGLAQPEVELAGIYNLEGNRLTIAYRKTGPRPEKFESTPGSGVTLLVLEGENQAKIAKAADTPDAQPATGDKSQPPASPWIGQLPNGAKVELLAIGEGKRWWQPNGSPLAEPPFKWEERRSQPAEPGFERRAFVARISGLPLQASGMNFIVEPSSGTNEWIDHETIQKVPTRSHFSGVQTAVPTAAKNVTLRWGVSTGPWEDAARAVVDAEGRPVGPGSSGDRLNSLRVYSSGSGSSSTTQLEMSKQPQYEERAIAIGNDGHETVAIFQESQGMARATLPLATTKQIKEIKLQRRPYVWVEFRDVPTRWSDAPIRSTDAPPNTCNVAAQATGSWLAQLPRGVTVDLVGVGEGDQWWRPDGSPLPEPPCRFESGAKSEDNTQVPRRFFLRVNGLPSQRAGIVAEVASGTAAEYPENLTQKGQVIANRVNVLAFETRIAATSRTITQLRCGVAVGPWKESISPSVNLYPKYIGGGGGTSSGRNTSLHAEEGKEGVVATVSEDWLDEDDLRLVAITYDGRAVTGQARIDHPTKQRIRTTITATLPGLTLKEIKDLNVERRPYDWVCFSYVAARRKSSEDTSIAESQPKKPAETPDAQPAAGEKPRPPALSPAIDPAAELKALFGQWKILSVEKGKNIDTAQGVGGILVDRRSSPGDTKIEGTPVSEILFTQGAGVYFREKELIFPGRYGIPERYTYQIDPSRSPKAIDLFEVVRGVRSEDAPPAPLRTRQGIYEFVGDRLKIQLRRSVPSVTSDQRPTTFAIEPDSGDVLLVLGERRVPSEDEKRMQGTWSVTSEIEDGQPWASERLKERLYYIDDDFVKTSERDIRGWGFALAARFTLDPTAKPKAITIWTPEDQSDKTRAIFGAHKSADPLHISSRSGEAEPAKAENLLGIYKFEDGQLHIAYRKGGPRPDKFESTSGSGVTLLVLAGENQPSIPRRYPPQSTASQPPLIPLAAVQGRVFDSAGKAVANVTVSNAGDAAEDVSVKSNAAGLFRLEGLYAGPIFVCAEKPGYRFRAVPARTGANDLVIKLPRDDEPLPPRANPAPASAEAQQKLARKIIEYLWGGGAGFNRESDGGRLVAMMARIDPEQARKWSAESGGKFDDAVREIEARKLAKVDVEKAQALLPADARWAHSMLFNLAKEYAQSDPATARRLAAAAAVQARRATDVREMQLARTGAMLFQLGDQDVGRKLIEEAAQDAEKLPALTADAARHRADTIGWVAASLALYDAPRAMALLDTIPADRRQAYAIEVALAIAWHDPGRGLTMLSDNRGSFATMAAQAKVSIALHLAQTRPQDAISIVSDIRASVSDSSMAWQTTMIGLEGLNQLAAAIAPRDKALACSVVDRGLASCRASRDGSPGMSELAGHAAMLAVTAERIGYPDVEGAISRALALRSARLTLPQSRTPSEVSGGFGPRAESAPGPKASSFERRMSLQASIRCDVGAAEVLALVDPIAARHLLEVIDGRQQILTPGLKVTGRFDQGWYPAWALADVDGATKRLDQTAAEVGTGASEMVKHELLDAASFLTLPPDERPRQMRLYW